MCSSLKIETHFQGSVRWMLYLFCDLNDNNTLCKKERSAYGHRVKPAGTLFLPLGTYLCLLNLFRLQIAWNVILRPGLCILFCQQGSLQSNFIRHSSKFGKHHFWIVLITWTKVWEFLFYTGHSESTCYIIWSYEPTTFPFSKPHSCDSLYHH